MKASYISAICITLALTGCLPEGKRELGGFYYRDVIVKGAAIVSIPGLMSNEPACNNDMNYWMSRPLGYYGARKSDNGDDLILTYTTLNKDIIQAELKIVRGTTEATISAHQFSVREPLCKNIADVSVDELVKSYKAGIVYHVPLKAAQASQTSQSIDP